MELHWRDPPPVTPACPFCDLAQGRAAPPGGEAHREGGFVVTGSLDPRRIRGWTVVAPLAHVTAWADLSDEEAATLGRLVRRASAAVLAETGAERVYTAVFAEAVPHLHVHLVPRGPEVPREDRGPAFLFDRAPRVSPETADAAARAIIRRVAE